MRIPAEDWAALRDEWTARADELLWEAISAVVLTSLSDLVAYVEDHPLLEQENPE